MYRYIGNKTKLAGEIVDKIECLINKGDTVADLMAGTGAISYELKNRGYKVIANDVMTYSKYHLMVNLQLDKYPVYENIMQYLELDNLTDSNYIDVLKYLNELPAIEGYFFQEFCPEGNPHNGSPSRKYFSTDNAKKIDAIRREINKWEQMSLLSPHEMALLKHTFLLAVNRVANISGTYGYFLSKLNKNALIPIKLMATNIECSSNINHVVLQGYAEDVSNEIVADLVYIDPPYIKRQYAANYHILETIARGDEPEAAGKSGLRPWRDQYSNFCSKVRIRSAFDKIITSINCKQILISYSEDGLLSINELIEFLSQYGEVSYETISHERFRSNNSKLPKYIKEFLVKLNI